MVKPKFLNKIVQIVENILIIFRDMIRVDVKLPPSNAQVV